MTTEQFLENIIQDDKTNCWTWQASLGKKRRPRWFGRDAKGKSTITNVARVAYELFIGTIPVDMELHHTCFNEWCVKPIHMELLTIAEHKLVHQQLGKRSARHDTKERNK